MKNFDYLVADRLDAALATCAEQDVTLKASGIDLLDLMKEHIETPETVLSIGSIEELAFIREQDDGVHIGAGTTLADMGRSQLLRERYAGLHESAAGAATPQVRERATLGGNLCQRPRCWYFRNLETRCLKRGGHMCYAVDGENKYHAIFGPGPCHIVHPSNAAPPLVALDAELVLRRQGGQRRLKAAEFFAMPGESLYAENVLRDGEVVTEVILPHRPRSSATVELREKQSFDWPLAMASVARFDDRWRVCLGAVAPVPWLSEPAMRVLGSSELTPERASRAGEAAIRDAEPMSDNGYKRQLVKVAVKRALLKAAGMEVGRE